MLSEVAIVVILILLGIGEFWMFDLVLILGLLFVITSLSQRRAKRHAKSKSGLKRASMQPGSLQESSEDERLRIDEGIREDGHASELITHGDHEQHEMSARSAAIVKIVIFFVQSTAAVVKPSAWPSWVVHSVEQLNALNLRVSGIECFAPLVFSRPEAKVLIQLSMPWFLGLNIIIASVFAMLLVKLGLPRRVKRLFSRCCGRVEQRTLLSASDEDGPAMKIEEPNGEDSPLLLSRSSDIATITNGESTKASVKWSGLEIRKRVQFSMLFLLSASYFELSNVVLEILRPCSKDYMVAFPWIPCDVHNSGQFTVLWIIALSFFVIYTIGIPVFFGVILRTNRFRIAAADPNVEGRVGFLYESYKYAW